MKQYRNPIRKRLPRDFRANIGRYLAIALIFVTMVAVIGGFLTAANGVRKALDRGIADGKIEDGQFAAGEVISDADIADIEDLDLKTTPNFYYEYEYDKLFTLRIFENRREINIPILHEGRLAEKDGEIAIDKLYADNIGISVGEIFVINGKDYKVAGLIWAPDYSSPYKKNSDIMQDAAHFGIALVSHDAFGAFRESQLTFNYAFRYDNAALSKSEKSDANDEIIKSLTQKGVRLTSFVPASENPAISFVQTDLGSDVPMMLTFLVVMMLILAFVFAVIIDHTIMAEAGSIGALMATGMKKRELVRHYLVLPLLITIISGSIGSILCSSLTYKFFDNMYHTAYSLPPAANRFDIQAALLTTVLPIVAMLAINLSVLCRRLSIMPIRFLRNEIKKEKKKHAIRLPDIPFLHRFRMRIILTNKGSFALLFAGILFANFILLMGLVLRPSIEGYIDDITKNAVAPYQYILKKPTEISEQSAEKFAIESMEFYDKAIDQSFDVALIGAQDSSKYFTKAALQKNSVLVSDGFMKKYGFEKSDTITLEDVSGEQINVTVGGSYPYTAGFAVIMRIDEMNALVGNDSGFYNGYFSGSELDLSGDAVATIITPDVLRGTGEQMLTTFAELMNICVFAAVVVHIVLISLLTKLILDKNAHNISLMKILGYKPKELRRIFLSATTGVVVFAILSTMFVDRVGIDALYIKMMFRKMAGYLSVVAPWWVYALMFAIGILCYLLVNILQVRRIQNYGYALDAG